MGEKGNIPVQLHHITNSLTKEIIHSALRQYMEKVAIVCGCCQVSWNT